MWSLVTYSNCFEWNLLKEQVVINLSVMLLHFIKGVLVFNTVYYVLYHYTDYIHGKIFAVPGFQMLEYHLIFIWLDFISTYRTYPNKSRAHINAWA